MPANVAAVTIPAPVTLTTTENSADLVLANDRVAAAKPEGLTVGLVQSVASPSPTATSRIPDFIVGLAFDGAVKLAA